MFRVHFYKQVGIRPKYAYAVRKLAAHPHRHHHEQSTIFQTDPPCGPVTLEDVDDIYPICSTIDHPEHRRACYLCYGMDMEKVEKYYTVVQTLQNQLKKTSNERKELLHFCIGRWNFTICLDILV